MQLISWNFVVFNQVLHFLRMGNFAAQLRGCLSCETLFKSTSYVVTQRLQNVSNSSEKREYKLCSIFKLFPRIIFVLLHNLFVGKLSEFSEAFLPCSSAYVITVHCMNIGSCVNGTNGSERKRVRGFEAGESLIATDAAYSGTDRPASEEPRL